MRLKFLHIPKTAGTTLIERYWHNDNFCAADREHQTPRHQVVFGHTVAIDDDPNTVYITAVRDPRERIISQYNFVRSQLRYMNPQNPTELDFYTWFINKEVIRPMRYTGMIDWLNQANGYWNTDTSAYDTMYSNQILHWDGETTSIEQPRLAELTERRTAVYADNYRCFRTNTHPRIHHYIDTSKDVVQEFESLCTQYDIQFDTVRDITRTNVTSDTLQHQQLKYTKYTDLPPDAQQMIEQETHYERRFYSEVV